MRRILYISLIGRTGHKLCDGYPRQPLVLGLLPPPLLFPSSLVMKPLNLNHPRGKHRNIAIKVRRKRGNGGGLDMLVIIVIVVVLMWAAFKKRTFKEEIHTSRHGRCDDNCDGNDRKSAL